MYWFSIWHWILAIVFIVVPLVYLAVGIAILARRKNANPGVSGLGGWMMTIVVIQLLLLILLVRGIPDQWEQYESVKGTVHGPLSVGGQMAMGFVLLLLVLLTTVALFRRSRRFPALYAIQWSVLFLSPAIGFFWEAWALGIELRQLARFYDIGTVLMVLAIVIVGGGTIWYLSVSQRSKNTFVR